LNVVAQLDEECLMSPVGWKALGQWGEDADLIEPLAGGVANRRRPPEFAALPIMRPACQ